MIDEIINRIDSLSEKTDYVIVGISGFPGSGKTTLTQELAYHYSISDAQVLHLDDLYVAGPRPDGLFDEYNWELLKKLLADARAGHKLEYRGVNWEGITNEWEFDEPLPPVLIVEGIKLFRPELMPYFDVSIWVDTPLDISIERAKARDRAQGHDKKEMPIWETKWKPMNREYVEMFKSDQLADLIWPNTHELDL